MTHLREAKRRRQEGRTGIPGTDGSSAEIQLTRDIQSDRAEEISKPTVTSEPGVQPATKNSFGSTSPIATAATMAVEFSFKSELKTNFNSLTPKLILG